MKSTPGKVTYSLLHFGTSTKLTQRGRRHLRGSGTSTALRSDHKHPVIPFVATSRARLKICYHRCCYSTHSILSTSLLCQADLTVSVSASHWSPGSHVNNAGQSASLKCDQSLSIKGSLVEGYDLNKLEFEAEQS